MDLVFGGVREGGVKILMTFLKCRKTPPQFIFPILLTSFSWVLWGFKCLKSFSAVYLFVKG